ncbi:hypothetical protein PMG11_10291 [Penicillium brasilianum]|uniref:Uncharacterized protein n=1 Tax=Penicillium brasilianum TaxID=104259 RepID=A0A0F7U348_PENBI|nr:hypothetical protein PMG11_10291 [Penicillium brasilianum]
MSDKQTSQEPVHQQEGFFERILHRHHQNQDAQYQKEPDQDKSGKDEHDHDEHDKKKGESELDKMKDYLHEDEELEAEGRTYGGLIDDIYSYRSL